jgi:hypothetical protein
MLCRQLETVTCERPSCSPKLRSVMTGRFDIAWSSLNPNVLSYPGSPAFGSLGFSFFPLGIDFFLGGAGATTVHYSAFGASLPGLQQCQIARLA